MSSEETAPTSITVEDYRDRDLDSDDIIQIAQALCDACMQRQLNSVVDLIDLAKSVGHKNDVLRYTDDKGRRPLHYAVLGGSLDIVKYFDKEEVVWCLADGDRNYPIHHALETNLNILTYLLQKGTNPNTKNTDGLSVLHLAAGSGNLDVVEIIVNNSYVRLDNKTTEKTSCCTALHLAVKYEHLDVVKVLCEKGASVNIKNEIGSTPLHCAAFTGNTAIIEYLIQSGANVDETDKGDKQPLHAAVYTNRFEAVKVLVQAGASVNTLDGHGYSPLHIAALTMECPEMMRFLIEHGADVNMTSQNRHDTPVLVASSMGDIEGIEILSEYGCDLDIVDKNGSSVLHKAISIPTRSWAKNPVKTIELLVSKGAKLDTLDDHGYTPLHVCAFQTSMHAFNFNTLKILTRAGAFARTGGSRPVEAASIGITPPLRNSPLCWLFWDGEFEAAEYLVAAGWDVAAEDWLHLHATVESQVNFMQRLLDYSRQPRPLIITCRDQIRKILSTVRQGREILSQIDLLPLPNKLKDFLKLNDL